MQALVIYYSFEGNTKLIAESIATELQADLLELKPIKEIEQKGFMKYFWGGKQVFLKQYPELEPLKKDPREYDVIFIGTPVWAWTFTPPFHTFFNEVQLKDKKIALFCCNGRSKGKTFTDLKKQLDGNTVLGEIEFQDPLRNNTNNHMNQAKKWAKDIMMKCI